MPSVCLNKNKNNARDSASADSETVGDIFV